MTRTAVIVAHGGRPEALTALAEAEEAFRAEGFEVIVHPDEPADLPSPTEHSLEGRRLPDLAHADIVVVLGGDGTILRAAELTRGSEAPILGVNLGHVGFLAESERDDLRDAVRRVASGDFQVEERPVVDVTVLIPGEPEPVQGWALNEATVEKSDRSRMIEVAIEVDGRPLSSFGCDGVVMATATGSTAHAFSAGGPVIWPDVDAMLLVPVAAHALFARPLVVGPGSMFAVELLARSRVSGVLTLDGRRRLELPQGSRVEVRRSSEPVRLARLSQAPFTDRLVNKFSLPVVGWRGTAAASTAGTSPEEGRA